ncbi:unnamed protein product, partial [Rotaria magnacalcarata]
MNLLKSKLMKKCNTLKKDVSKIPSNIILTKHPSVNTLKALIMSDTPSNINLTEQVLSFRNELFYDLVKQQCGTIALEIMQVENFINTLHGLNQQYLKSFMRHNSNNSNSSNDLIVPEYLLKKFPFIQTLIVYSNLIMKNKYDFTFLNIILNNIFRNLSTEERGFRYEDVVRQFATSLYILGGRTAYESIRLNIPVFLPT